MRLIASFIGIDAFYRVNCSMVIIFVIFCLRCLLSGVYSDEMTYHACLHQRIKCGTDDFLYSVLPKNIVPEFRTILKYRKLYAVLWYRVFSVPWYRTFTYQLFC